MPFTDESPPLGPVQRLPDPSAAPTPGFFEETFPAAFRVENTVVSALVGDSIPFPERLDLTFDPFSDIEGYEDFAEAFIPANNPDDVVRVKAQIDRELEDRRTLQAAGLPGMAAIFTAAAIDPVILLPVGGAAVGPRSPRRAR